VTRAATLTPEQRTSRWKILTLKVLWVFRAVATKAAAVAVLGQQAYLAIVEEIRTEAPMTDPGPRRIYQGEIVGKELAPSNSTGEALRRPLCAHDSLRKRGNRSAKWFCCTTCGARFERKALGDLPEDLPTEVILAATQASDPLTQQLARNLLSRDEHFRQALEEMDMQVLESEL
jgi:hypothetical protein